MFTYYFQAKLMLQDLVESGQIDRMKKKSNSILHKLFVKDAQSDWKWSVANYLCENILDPVTGKGYLSVGSLPNDDPNSTTRVLIQNFAHSLELNDDATLSFCNEKSHRKHCPLGSMKLEKPQFNFVRNPSDFLLKAQNIDVRSQYLAVLDYAVECLSKSFPESESQSVMPALAFRTLRSNQSQTLSDLDIAVSLKSLLMYVSSDRFKARQDNGLRVENYGNKVFSNRGVEGFEVEYFGYRILARNDEYQFQKSLVANRFKTLCSCPAKFIDSASLPRLPFKFTNDALNRLTALYSVMDKLTPNDLMALRGVKQINHAKAPDVLLRNYCSYFSTSALVGTNSKDDSICQLVADELYARLSSYSGDVKYEYLKAVTNDKVQEHLLRKDSLAVASSLSDLLELLETETETSPEKVIGHSQSFSL